MQGTCYKNMTSVLALVIDAKIAKTDTSFLALEALDDYLNSGPSHCNSNK